MNPAPLARSLGAVWVGGSDEMPPVELDSAIVFAPAGELVPLALAAVGRGGTVALAGIHMTRVPPLDYGRHLFHEKTLTSVAANTRADGEELLRLAPRLGFELHVSEYPFTEVDRALLDLVSGRLSGSAVISGYPDGARPHLMGTPSVSSTRSSRSSVPSATKGTTSTGTSLSRSTSWTTPPRWP